MSLSNGGDFSRLAGIGFDRPNIQAFHSATMGTNTIEHTIGGMKADAANEMGVEGPKLDGSVPGIF